MKDNIMKENLMREVKIEKVVLSVGGIGDELEKGIKLLELLTKRKIMKTKSKKRIPSLSVRPGLEIGGVVTIRRNYEDLLKKLFVTVDNQVRKKQISENNFSFGIKEYIEIPGMEYNREIGMLGLETDIVFKRKGKRVKIRKIKKGKYPKRQSVTKQEIIDYLIKHFNL